MPLFGQSAIKLKKQRTRFYYVQLNLHGGFIHDDTGDRWDCASEGPKNQLAFQWVTKRNTRMQKGYIPLISLSSSKLRFTGSYDRRVGFLGRKVADMRLVLLDASVKFDTKWDRTSLTVGFKQLPYGHNPQIDPVSSFMTNLINTDLGMNRDLGVFFRTPLTKRFDLDIAITSGGWLNRPLMICNNLAVNEDVNEPGPNLNVPEFTYLGTWMVSGRIGSASFNKNEFGMVYAVGQVNELIDQTDLNHIYRVGGEWIFKHKEKIKLINQVTAGPTVAGPTESYFSLNSMNGFDYYFKDRFVFSASHALSRHANTRNENVEMEQAFLSSLTYTVSPHTRIRFNQFFRYDTSVAEDSWGVFLQFVTGIGKRP